MDPQVHETVFLSYVDQLAPSWERQKQLQEQYYFVCQCSRCQDSALVVYSCHDYCDDCDDDGGDDDFGGDNSIEDESWSCDEPSCYDGVHDDIDGGNNKDGGDDDFGGDNSIEDETWSCDEPSCYDGDHDDIDDGNNEDGGDDDFGGDNSIEDESWSCHEHNGDHGDIDDGNNEDGGDNDFFVYLFHLYYFYPQYHHYRHHDNYDMFVTMLISPVLKKVQHLIMEAMSQLTHEGLEGGEWGGDGSGRGKGDGIKISLCSGRRNYLFSLHMMTGQVYRCAGEFSFLSACAPAAGITYLHSLHMMAGQVISLFLSVSAPAGGITCAVCT